MKVIGFLVSFGLFVGGIFLMASSFAMVGFEYVAFMAGLLASCLGVFIPIHVLKRIDG